MCMFRSYLLCTLTNKSEVGVSNIFTLKPAIMDTLFTLKIGSERLSLQVQNFRFVSVNGKIPSK